MTASERIRAAREAKTSLVSALDQNPVETRKYPQFNGYSVKVKP